MGGVVNTLIEFRLQPSSWRNYKQQTRTPRTACTTCLTDGVFENRKGPPILLTNPRTSPVLLKRLVGIVKKILALGNKTTSRGLAFFFRAFEHINILRSL